MFYQSFSADCDIGGVSSLTDLTPQFSDIDLTPRLGMQSSNKTVYTQPKTDCGTDKECDNRWAEEDAYIKEASKVIIFKF